MLFFSRGVCEGRIIGEEIRGYNREERESYLILALFLSKIELYRSPLDILS
jgi:hypothetical protein